jgi:hypothetical protein
MESASPIATMAGAEIVAVGVHHALAVAVEKALALKALIEELRIGFLRLDSAH